MRQRAVLPWLLIPSFLVPLSAWATCPSPPCCTQSTACMSKGHNSFSAGDYPYTEEIVSANDTPISSPQVLTGPTFAWTQIAAGCVDLGGMNLNGTQAFNALLRVNVPISSTTAAVGARYEVQLLVDGQQYGWYVKRLRGKYPQFDLLMATSRGLSGTGLTAGNHAFTVQARLLDAGTMTLNGTWAAAFGSPTANTSVASVSSSQISLANIFYQPVTNVVSFSNSQPIDFVVQGYFQIDSGTVGQSINLAPFLDGVRQSPIATLGIPQNGYEGINFLSVLPNVAAGTHQVEWRVVTNGHTTLFSNREIDGVGFPTTSFQVFPQATSTLTVTSMDTPPHLGSGPGNLFLGCGHLTQLLTATIPVDGSAYNTFYEGYVELTGAQTGTGSFADLWFETFFNSPAPQPWTDGGARSFELGTTDDGVYIVGDAAAFGEGVYTETINLWGRKIATACGGGTGTYDVGKRFFWVRHVPISPSTSCLYQ